MQPGKQLLLGILLCFSVVLNSQNQLIGTILCQPDSAANPAIVTLPDINTSLVCDASGRFEIKNLTNGYYKLVVIKPGYKIQSLVAAVFNTLTIINIQLTEEANRLDEIVVFGNQQNNRSESSNNIEVLETRKMRELGALSLSDGIAKLPGINQLSTGAGISKPVIRGLFGNRIQTVLLGLRFDNQQWQDEHGLGLSDIGVDHVEIIKGPSTLFYGSEAMGGVLNIIGEKPAPVGKIQADVSSRYFSNTYGYTFDAGVKKSTEKINWGIRLGTESHADYSDGNNKRILNSRFGGYSFKTNLGFKIKNWNSDNNCLFGLSNFGFLMDAYQLYDKADERQSRSFEKPHHTVLFNIFSSQNTLLLKKSKLKINLGTHFNNRQEQEGASGISLYMLLNTYVMSALWQKNINQSTEWSVGTQNQYQTNVNQGSRIIVPDANLGEASLFTYLKKRFSYLITEGGIRYDFKTIRTLPTSVLNTGNPFNPGINVIPVSRSYNTINGSFGVSVFGLSHFNFKVNASSGYRGPNLAELSSNGLHEGSVRYEVGNVNLKLEQNICVDAYVEYYNKSLTLFADAYLNRFFNYIYLQPGTAEYIGFKIYNYIQENATLKGTEGGIKIHPDKIRFLKINATYSGIIGLTDRHQYLPFIPAQKINTEIRLIKKQFLNLRNCFISFGYIYVFAQNKANQFETPSPFYNLINATIGTEMPFKRNNLIISVAGNNLSNESYYDHLSRFKYFGIYNIGRNISLSLKFQFN